MKLGRQLVIGIVVTFPKFPYPILSRDPKSTYKGYIFYSKMGTLSCIISIVYSMTPSEGFVMPPFNYVHMLRTMNN